MVRVFGRATPLLDLTELPGLDDLHWPDVGGPVADAQALAAQVYGAAAARLLVGGATAGVLAMVLAAAGPGRTLLATMPFHRSVAAAAILSGCRLRALPPRLVGQSQVPAPEGPGAVAAALAGTRPAALLVTSPTYHGLTADLAGIAAVCREAGVPLLVDAAHGAHFGFSPLFPPAPPALGVSACVVSLHKTAGSLTPGALLLVGSARAGEQRPAMPEVDLDRVSAALRLVETSSPPYPVLASLDLARRRLALRGRADWEQAARLSAWTLERVRRRSGGVLAPLSLPAAQDPTRMVFELSPLAPPALTGLVVAERAGRAGVDLELAGWGNVVAVATPADSAKSHRRLAETLVAASVEASPAATVKRELALRLEKDCWNEVATEACLPGQAFRAPRHRLPVARAVGRVAADIVCPYPPGVPLVLPGQVLAEPVARYLVSLADAGYRVQGLSDFEIEVVR